MVAVVVGCHGWRGSSTRNIGGTMIGAASSGVMMSVDTVEGVKTLFGRMEMVLQR